MYTTIVKQPNQQTIVSPNTTNMANNAVTINTMVARQESNSSLPEDVPDLPSEHSDNSDDDVIHGITSVELQGKDEERKE